MVEQTNPAGAGLQVGARSGAPGSTVPFANAPIRPADSDHQSWSRRWRRLRFIPLAIGAAGLAVGLWSGLVRLGLVLPGVPAIAEFHGALMICGFLGTLISLERAVAVGRWWA